jgi:hypothetical protein
LLPPQLPERPGGNSNAASKAYSEWMIIKQPQLMQFMQLCLQLWVIRTVCLHVMPQHLFIEQSCGIIISCDD